MNREVVTYNAIEGYHYYPDAPSFCSYLKNKHRHIFEIRCHFAVSHNNREIEINEQQKKIETFLKSWYGSPCIFGAMSCEDIAEVVMNQFECITKVEVLEDGYGGATLTK